MFLPSFSLVCLSVLASLSPGSPLQQPESENPVPKVLFLTHSAGFVHSVVRRPAPEQLAFAERVLTEASRGRLQIDCTQDCSAIEAKNLANYDVVLFYTTGKLPISEEGKSALIDWVRKGGAFCGAHCATDTFYEFADYMGLVGGAFDGHPWHEKVTLKVEDDSHQSTRHLDSSWVLTDEIYQFKWWRRHPNHVLLSLDTEATDVTRGKRADRDYANAWCKDYGQGKVFYTALGHREDVWTNPAFQEHLIGGIEWAIDGKSVSVPAPTGALSLLDASASDPQTVLAGWNHQDGSTAKWKVATDPDAGHVEIAPGTGNLFTGAQIGGDFLLHVEFLVPLTSESNGWQSRGNSGVYVQSRYEIQVLDSFGIPVVAKTDSKSPAQQPVVLRSGDCGGIYGKHVARVNACKPAGTWQSYDIEFRSPRHGQDGAKTESVRMSVWHNGILIHDDVEVDSPTGAAASKDEPGHGPLMLQDHGHPVRYRNIWLLPR